VPSIALELMMTAVTDRPAVASAPAPVPPDPAPLPRGPASTSRAWWAVALAGGAGGMVTAGIQTVERIEWAQNPGAAVACDLSAVISCSGVFAHWQSSALGIPNSIIALPVFAMLASAALAGVLGARLPRPYLASMLGLSVFMTAFVTWYLVQSAFAMGVLCLFCLGCGVAILLASAGLTRAAAAEGALGSGRLGRTVDTMVRSGADLLLWGGLALVVGLMLLLTFAPF
jgi:uncharacterized membrane protein